jgi:hypothetical protein
MNHLILSYILEDDGNNNLLNGFNKNHFCFITNCVSYTNDDETFLLSDDNDCWFCEGISNLSI